MVSFSCEVCNDTIKKPKLDAHKVKCRSAYFTCLDCNTTFNGGEHKSHTSCISEAQKYQGALYKPEKGKGKGKGNKNGQEANGKYNTPTASVENESLEIEVGDVEMVDATPVEAPVAAPVAKEKREVRKEKSTKKDNLEKQEKARKHKKERKERKKEAKNKVVEESKEESKPTEEPTVESVAVAESEPAKPTEETRTTEKNPKKKNKEPKKDKKTKGKPTATTEAPKAKEAAAKAAVTELKLINAVPEAPVAAKKSEKKDKKPKDKKRKLVEVISEPTNGITETSAAVLPAAEAKPEESSPAKKAKKEKLSPQDNALVESFLAIFQKGHLLTLGKALARLEKEHGADAQKRLLEVIRLKKIKGELIVSIS